ncbi:oligosaccharide flippase family protein [Maribacter sp. MAR_2009_72]|uniref:oligosaccharide flippase family protein n=1 Tax=Maribacter sp. MAR_2009_72 TaxID=1250050 RepID=UPI00119C81C1|nr:oligosaccharide flippase family protein [Maribacter sp. MAR_2009_72]TVZ16177.1 O-antigen/teichoic acid export membrane protein [Maribacter sp. MAR_2009_72]
MATVSKNIFWQSIAAFLQIYTGGIVFILLAKIMSIEDFGILSFGFSFSTLLSTCLDFGQSLMIMKDYPQKKFQPGPYILNSMAQKVIFILIFCGLFFTYLIIFYSGKWLVTGQMFILFAIVSAYVLYLQAVLRVKNRFKDAALSIIAYSVIITILVYLIYNEMLSMLQFIGYLILARVIQLLVTVVFCKNIFQKKWFSPKIQKHLIKHSWSYGAHFIFGTFYFTVDTQIIALLLNAKDVALYQSIFRIIYIFLIVSDVASNVLLPYLSSKFAKNQSIDLLSSNILYLLFILGSSLFLFFTFFYKEIIDVLYTPEYKEAYPLVFPLSLVILLRTSSSIYGTLLTISDNQINRVKVVFLTMVSSILLNSLLIPFFGIRGSAWISVFVHLLLFSGYLWFSKKDFPDIKILTSSNMAILLTTAFFVVVEQLIYSELILIRIALYIIWGMIIVYFMKKYEKVRILSQILKDKGVV